MQAVCLQFQIEGVLLVMRKNNRLLTASYLAFDGLLSSALPKRPHILIACMPKSASTFMADGMSRLPGFRRCRLTPDWGAREQELCSIRLSRYNHSKYVAQHHLRNSAWTQYLIKQYGLTPVVLVRDFADCAISVRDHFQREPGEGPTAYFDKSHLALSDAEFEEAVVRLAIPWYMNFYAGWRAHPNILMFDYAEYTAYPTVVTHQILEQANCSYAGSEIEKAFGSADGSRFNVGTSGRGSQLSPPAKQALLDLMKFYPNFKDDPLFIKTRATIG